MRRTLPLLLAGTLGAPVLAVAAPAYAAGTTADYLAELHAAATPTKAASTAGWSMHLVAHETTGRAFVSDEALDAVHHMSRSRVLNGGSVLFEEVAVTGKGTYVRGTVLGTHTAVDLRLLHKSWMYVADGTTDAADEVDADSPADLLNQIGTDNSETVTSITRADGTDGARTYEVKTKDSDGTFTSRYVLDPSGKLAGVAGNGTGVKDATLTPGYGAQHVSVPPRTQYATQSEVARVDAEIASLSTRVKATAARIVTGAKAAAKKAHRRSLRASDLKAGVAYAKKHPTTAYVPVTVRAVRGGYRVTATSPYTHKAAAKTVTLVRGSAKVS